MIWRTLQFLIYLLLLLDDVSGISAGWTQTRLPANSIVDIVGAACSLSSSQICAIVGNQVIVNFHSLTKIILILLFKCW